MMLKCQVVFLLSSLLVGSSHDGGSLSGADYLNGPIPFQARIDSLITALGHPTSVVHSVGFCGKGPKMIGDSIVGEEMFCDSLRVYTFDSLTICTDDQGAIEYYSFTVSRFVTARGIQIGDRKEKILQTYGAPTWYDSAYVYSDRKPPEDDEIQYAVKESNMGIAFYLSRGVVYRIFIGRGRAC
jgi:hypothetical protein